jgi:hypothetical protein
MGKAIPIQTNFSGGELSPRVGSRIDIAKYNNGLKVAENVQVVVQGGARGRPGLRFVRESKDSTKRSRLIGFAYNRDQAYMLEVGNLYMRVFKDGAVVGAPYEIVTPYTEAMLPDVAYVQGADTMFLVHPDVPVYRLQRFGDQDWRMLPAPFTVEPFAEIGIKPALVLTLSAASVGVGRNFGATAAFLLADVGRDIVSGSGQATITAFVDVNNVTAQIKSAFVGVSIASGAWTIDGSPQTTLTASAVGPVGTAITLTLSAAGWRAGAAEVGKYVKVNGGLVRIDSYVSGVVVNATVQQVLSSVTPAIANSWSLNASIWGGTNGYPRAVTIHEQRLYLAGSPGFPQHIAGSRIGDYLNFELGTKEDDAFLFELSTSQIAPIQHLTQGKRLLVMTGSNEMSLRGGAEKPITPTNIQKNDESSAGANTVRPVKIGNEVMFVQRAGRKVRALGYRYEIEGFASPDRTVFSEHITDSKITDMAFQQEPDALLTCVRTDGELAACTYDAEQEVNAWKRWITDGSFESVASIPTTDAEQTWAIVKRTIGGVTKRYVEYFDPLLRTDSAVTGVSGPGTDVWTGLSHLNGKTVKVVADGAYMGEYTVAGGQITLTRNAFAVQIGLAYTPLMQLLNPEVGSQGGTSQGASISVGEVIVRVLDTVSAVINGQTKTFRKMGSFLLDQPPEMGSGDLRETTLSDEMYRNELIISQPNPVDFHVLAVIRKCTVND